MLLVQNPSNPEPKPLPPQHQMMSVDYVKPVSIRLSGQYCKDIGLLGISGLSPFIQNGELQSREVNILT